MARLRSLGSDWAFYSQERPTVGFYVTAMNEASDIEFKFILPTQSLVAKQGGDRVSDFA